MVRYFLILFVLGLISSIANGQKSIVYQDINHQYNIALELFTKEKFGAAQKQFKTVSEYYGEEFSDVKTDAEYFSAICALKLFNQDAEYLLSKFISSYPESPRVKSAYFQMGNYQFRNKKYRKALKWYKGVDIFDMQKEELAEYYFKTGYCNYNNGNMKEANKAFYEIKDVESKYSEYALYYYSHIEYTNGNYQTSLTGFEKLSENEMFAPRIPYYITQIYFYQKKYEELIKYAPPLLKSATTKRTPEISRVIGESYYRTFKYKEAIPYLEKFMSESSVITREDYYKIAYCYYRDEQYEKAAKKFSSIANATDLLAQNAYYHLADCYLRLEQKEKARYAFHASARLNFDKSISESSLFNYAKLSYELSMYPFNEAITAFNSFIETYHDSPLIDDARQYLVKVFLTTKNYKDALKSIESLKNVTQDIALVYQRIAYYHGLELFIDNDFKGAIEHFDKSIDNVKLNPVIKAQSYYWKAEAFYRLKNWNEAIKYYNEFILSDGAFELDEYKIAHYNLGYAYFKLKEWDDAITALRKYERFVGESKDEKLGDSFNRIGDSYYMKNKYDDAIVWYEKAIAANLIDVDYALYQKGMVMGYDGDYNQRIIALNQLLNDYSKSSFRPDALYQLAISYVVIESPDMGNSTYQTLIEEYPNSDYVRKAYLNMALNYRNSNNTNEAIDIYKKVVNLFWGEDVVDDALRGLEKIYIEENNFDEYIEYLATIGHSMDKAREDSITFYTAERGYMKDGCEGGKDELVKYINKFPHGKELLKSHYYVAECNYSSKQFEEALKSYEFIAKQTKNRYTTHAMVRSARINYKMENYKKAAQFYLLLESNADARQTVLEARVGKMRCDYILEDYDKTVKSAIRVLKMDKLSEELFRESHFKIAKSYYMQEEYEKSFDEFQIVSQEVKSIEGAESKYRLAELYFKAGKDSLCELEIMNWNQHNTSHSYWVASSYMILADIYMKRDEGFQAKGILMSIITNYETRSDGIIEQAEEKYEDIQAEEEANLMLEKSLEIDILDMGGGNDLFKSVESGKSEDNKEINQNSEKDNDKSSGSVDESTETDSGTDDKSTEIRDNSKPDDGSTEKKSEEEPVKEN